MQYLKLPPNPCYCCRVQLMLCIIHFRFFSGMVQYMLVFSTSVEVASKRHLVKSFYSSKCSHNPSGIILTRIGCLAPAGCTVSVCIQLHWQNSCFRKSHIRSFQPVLKQKSSVHIKNSAAIDSAASRSLRRFRRISSERLCWSNMSTKKVAETVPRQEDSCCDIQEMRP